MEQTYRAFGLTITSELPLAGLPAANGAPAVQIRRGTVPGWNGDAAIRYKDRCQINGQEWIVRSKSPPFAGLIRDGKLVLFEADPAQEEGSSLYVLGSCTGALLFQRGLVPLHGNTIAGAAGAAMIVGKIGAGKSATTLALMERRYKLVADDISAVSFQTNEPRVMPGFPRLKLWKSTLEHFGCDHRDLHRLRPGMDKFHYPVEDRFCAEPQKLNAIYILQPGAAPTSAQVPVRIRALSGVAKLDAVRAHLYKIRFHDAVRNWPPLLGKICSLADTVRVCIVERPREGVTIEAVADAIDADFQNARQCSRNAASGA